MNKTMIALVLLVLSGNAMADWVKVGGSADGTVSYANPSTIRKNGNMAKIWSLLDYTKARTLSNMKYLSMKSLGEYDCKGEQMRMLAFSWFSENMGEGDVVYTDSSAGNWLPVQPDSLGEGLWKYACEK
jgi:hypothetical protein